MRLTILKTMAAGALALSLTATGAHATLIEQDLNTAGDKLITLDTVTGLEWLDVDQTLNQSYITAETSVFVTLQGFRHANVNEVSALYTNVGVTNQSGVFTAANFAGVQELLAKLGCVTFCFSQLPRQQAFADLVPFSTTNTGSPFIRLDLNTNTADAQIASQTGKTITAGLGNYLVRPATSVSEPPSWALMLGGLTVLAGFRRRHKNG